MKNIVLILLCVFFQTSLSQDLNIEKYRKSISITVDKFTNEKRMITPVINPIIFIKVIQPKDTLYMMKVQCLGSTLATGNNTIILLENGGKITKDVQTEVEYESYGYVHSAFFQLTDEDIELLKKFRITDIRIYIHDLSFKNKNTDKYIAYLLLLQTMN